MSSIWGDAENLSCYLSFNLRAPPTLGNREQGVSICIQYNWTEKCLLEGLHLLRDFFFPPLLPEGNTYSFLESTLIRKEKWEQEKPIFSPSPCSVAALSPPHPLSLLLLRCMRSPGSGPHSPVAILTYQWHTQAKRTGLSHFLIPLHCCTAVQYLHHAHIASFPVDFTFTEQEKKRSHMPFS